MRKPACNEEVNIKCAKITCQTGFSELFTLLKGTFVGEYQNNGNFKVVFY